MKFFLKNSAFVLLFGFAVYQHALAQTFNPVLAAKLQQTLDNISFQTKDTKGVSASVYYPGQGVWKGTYGVSHAGVPITTDMKFGIASNTKLFVAAAIMKLVEDNVLHLNDPLHKWISKYKNIDSTITVAQLLNHSSGIDDVSDTLLDSIKKDPSRVFAVDEVLSWVGPKLFSPGAGQGYTNTNYIVAALVAESTSGHHISKLIRDNILIPQQLDSTFYSVKETITGTIAHPWVKGVDDYAASRVALHTAGGAAGAMYSTASDMVRWYEALLSGHVVNGNSLAQMTTFVGAKNYGFGIIKLYISPIKRTIWGHSGGTLGYNSRVMYDPLIKATVCTMSNSDLASIDATAALLVKTLVDNLPDIAGTVSGPTSVCQGQRSATYTVPAIDKATSYVWTLPNGATGTSSTNSITVQYSDSAASGNITVAGANVCENGVASVLAVTVRATPTVVLELEAPKIYCQNTLPVKLSGGFPVGGIYSGKGVKNGVFDPAAAGEGDVLIFYTYSNEFGCSASDSTLFRVTPQPLVSCNFSADTSFCINSPPINLSGGTPIGGIYSGRGVIDGIFNPALAGEGDAVVTYTYVAANGCTNADSAILHVALPTSATLKETVAGSFTLNGKTYTETGIYTQALKNKKGCDSTITLDLTILATGVGESSIANRYSMYPNPSDGTFTLTTDAASNIAMELEIYSIAGVKMFSTEIQHPKTDVMLYLQPGVYMYYVKEKNHHVSGVGKLIVH